MLGELLHRADRWGCLSLLMGPQLLHPLRGLCPWKMAALFISPQLGFAATATIDKWDLAKELLHSKRNYH